MKERREREQLLACLLDMGELLLISGAEVMRVEDTIARLCAVYGFTGSDVFVITSSIVLTARTPAGDVLTQTRRIRERDTDLGRVEQVNALSRQLCERPLPAADLLRSIRRIRELPGCSARVRLAMYVGISAVFALFFGGSAFDATAAAVAGATLFVADRLGRRLRLNGILQAFFSSILAALTVVLLHTAGLPCTPGLAVTGNIMLLIPGLALTTSLRDMIRGDTISGLLGFSEAIIKALAVAAGFAAVLYGLGGLAG